MSPVSPTIEPLLSAEEREELGHLDYLQGRMKALLEKGVIAADSCATIVAEGQARREAIEKQGRYLAAISRAKSLAKSRPGDALVWADRASQIDPSLLEALVMAIDLNWQVEEDDRAIAVCSEAVDRFPQLKHKLERLLSLKDERAEARRIKAEQLEQDRLLSERLHQAKIAMEHRRDAEAIALCQEILAVRPHQSEAMTIAAYAHQRMGQLDEALALYESLESLQPSIPTWSQWVRTIKTRQRVVRMTGISPDSASANGHPTGRSMAGIAEPPPPFSWSGFAGEFLQEHWQKLILCLAVLLIVVSSTFGAHRLLGPLLWSPVGKCAMALVWTMMFAGLGKILVRWGAIRAGQMMLVTTLIVVPIHFMLAGELKLLMEPSATQLAVAAVDGLALVALVRMVSGMLVPRAEARFLTVALLLMSVGSAATAPGAPVPWGWQFAAFQAPAVVFLGAVWAVGARRWGASREEHRQFATLVLGLLGFAGLACLIRIGVHVLNLEPAYYGVPVMLAAIACVRTARKLAPYEPDAQRIALIELGGYALSGLAFALSLSSPPIHSAVFSGNTIVVSLLGFSLYVVSLREKRHPVFLYLAIGAIVAARVGAHYFLADRIRMVIEFVRQALGYQDALPWAFLSILGLVVNPVLALLSVWFSRAWKDDRLAKHCHYIGVPLAIAACIFSGLEPLAGAICLSGYAILFALAVGIFAAPAVTFLTIFALTGAVYFWSSLIPGVTVADQAMLVAVLAWGCWGISRILQRLDLADVYALPWTMAARGLLAIAMVGATLFIAVKGPNSIGAAGAFLLIGSLAFEWNRERPWVVRASVTLLNFLELTICGLALATGGGSLPASEYGSLLIGDALAFLALAEILRLGTRAVVAPAVTPMVGGWPTLRPAEAFLGALPRFVIAMTLIADWLALFDHRLPLVSGLVWLLGSPALLGTTRFLRQKGLVYLGLAQLVAGTLELSSWAVTWGHSGLAIGWLSVVSALIALSLWLVASLGRRRGLSDFYSEPCVMVSLLLTTGVFSMAVSARVMVVDAYRLGVIALGLNAVATMLLARSFRQAGLTYAAVLHLVTATYMVLFSVGNNDPSMAYVLGLCAVIEAIAFWAVALGCETWGSDWFRSCARPLYHSTVALTILGIPLADYSAATMLLAAVAFLLTVKSLSRAEWLYAVVAAVGSACYLRWLAAMPPMGVVGFAMGSAFGLWAIGVMIQRSKPALCAGLRLRPLDYEYRLFHSSIAVGVIALAVRVSLSLGRDVPWTAYPWFPLGLSVLSVLMLRAYPRREWVHAGLAFLVWSVVAAITPSLTSACWLAMAGTVAALGLAMMERAIRSHEATICDRLGVIDAGYAPVVRGWASVLFGVAAVLTIGIVLNGMGAAMIGYRSVVVAATVADWWILLATIGLTAVFLAIENADAEGWGTTEPETVLIGLHWIGVLALWWLGVEASPMAGRLLSAAEYYPAVTAMAALAAVQFGRRYAHLDSWLELSWLGDVRSERSTRMMSYQACILAVLAVVFTGGAVTLTTVATLTLAAITLGFGAMTIGSPVVAGMGSVAWAGAWSVAGLLVARHLGYRGSEPEGTWGASGAIASAFLLWWLAGRLRVEGANRKDRSVLGASESAGALRRRMAEAMEGVASAVALAASAVVLAIGNNGGSLGLLWTFAGVGVLLAAAVLHILLVPRWRAEWLVYLAHALMLGAYIDFRMAFPMSTSADAAILTLLGFIDLGLSEALARLQGPEYYVRPTRHFSLILPLLPLLQLLGKGMRDEVSLFYLSVAATFYAIACAQMRWKSLGYAAAVFCNAALWLCWSRMGWMMADHPQFYLIPVGLSTILFAEVNRELGRSTVNAIRSAGLILIYISLSVPIWRFDSFGAWLTLLLVSLVGIFAGIGFRLQTFLWLGLTTFVLDLVYEMGRVSIDYAFAKWAIMLMLGITLVLFVALNEKKRIVSTMLDYYARARTWE
jgi:tetratricopeptide (TPR) repeat protein